MYYIYVLQSKKDDSWYIGCTNDLNSRLKQHNLGKSKYTKNLRPWKIIYYEASFNKTDAFRRERYLKSGYGRRFLKSRLKYYLEARDVK